MFYEEDKYEVLERSDKIRNSSGVNTRVCLAKLFGEDKANYFTYLEVYENKELELKGEANESVEPMWFSNYEEAKDNFLNRIKGG
ncbi:MAG: hypothetical protein R6V17_00145 [Halanaerobacter sp.]